MSRSSLLLLLLPFGATFAQPPKQVVDLTNEGIFQIVDSTDLRSRQIESRDALPPSVPADLQQPIEQLRAAIESGVPSKIVEVYPGYEQDSSTKHFLTALLGHADSVHVKSLEFRSSNMNGNVAEVRYRMLMAIRGNGSKVLPTTEVRSTWRADLGRDGPKQPWKIKRLTRLGL